MLQCYQLNSFIVSLIVSALNTKPKFANEIDRDGFVVDSDLAENTIEHTSDRLSKNLDKLDKLLEEK